MAKKSKVEKQDDVGSDEGSHAILRVPEIISAVANRPEGYTFSQLRDTLGLPKSSLHRLLRTLEQSGYLDNYSGNYVLGAKSLQLGRDIMETHPPDAIRADIHSTLEWLAAETQETVIYAVLDANREEMVYIDIIESKNPLRFTVPQGNRRPLYAAASGQVVLAFMDDASYQAYIDRTHFISFTDETLDAQALASKIKRIREDGFAFDRNSSFRGASAVASPCCDRDGLMQSSVSLAGPTERIEQSLDRLGDLLRRAGERISRIKGYEREYPPLI